MNLLLKRVAKTDTYTIGKLYIDGVYFSDTIEDKDRGLSQEMTKEYISKTKIYGETAIPTGTYSVDMSTVSQKFKGKSWAKPYKGKVPRLEDVPGYSGILIHPGNTAKDSLGCILVGENKIKGQVVNSQNTFHKLMNILGKEQNIIITIQ